MKLELLNWDAALREERHTWCEMLLKHRFNPTLHPAWLDSTLRSRHLERSVYVAVIRDRGNTHAIIPFVVRNRTLLGFPCRVLDLCSNLLSYHAEILSDNILESLELLLHDRRVPAWDVFRAANIVSPSASSDAITSLASRSRNLLSTRAGESSPYVVIDQSWDSFLHSRPKKLRANVTRSERLMKEAGETGMCWYEVNSDTRPLLREILEIESQSWKLSAGVAIVAGTAQHSYYERLLPWLSDNGILANVLYVKNQPIAYTLCTTWQGWVGQLKTSYCSDYRDAGSRVIHSSLQRAFDKGFGEYDFLGDVAPHKLRWADHIRTHVDYWLFGSHLRAKLLGAIKKRSDWAHEWRQARSTAKRTTAGSENVRE